MEELIQKTQVNNSTSISKMARDLLYFAQHLSFHEKSSLDIVEKVINIFLFKNKKRLNAEFKVRGISPKQYFFKKNERDFLFEKVIFFYKRDYLKDFKPGLSFERFETLNYRERSILTMLYRFNIKADDICYILQVQKSSLFEILYNAKFKLGIIFDIKEESEDDLSFSNNDAHYFYERNLRSYEGLNTKNKPDDFERVMKKIPKYLVNSEDHFHLTYAFINGFQKLSSNQTKRI